jgi:hypothetical protein
MGCRSNGRHGQSFTIHGKASQSREEMARVTRESHALTLDEGVFSQRSPGAIARSLKRSAERSRARKSAPYRSAMSMLTFYINRGGAGLPASRRKTLEAAKGELRHPFDKQKA